ncbi:hypothetical protein B0H14DRAFT_3631582 [Mycena olivaceomarginata]|nr:hypothetical protein B0H14DRAFT_3666016 [Mycena olivaceomarginata]KAJ7717174.1 hypothetical protein B0H14DRAFT_3631582 [Mycena olivaceomarginata]
MKTITTIVCFSSLLFVHGIPMALTDEAVVASSVMGDGHSPTAFSRVVSSSSPTSEGESPSPSISATAASNFAVASVLPAGKIKLGANKGSDTVAAYDVSGKPLGNFTADAKLAGSGKAASAAVAGNLTTTSTVDTCRPATDSELSTIPGWNKLFDSVAKWATTDSEKRPAKAYINFDGYQYTSVGVPQVCYSTDTVTIDTSGPPSCQTRIDKQTITSDEIAQNTTISRTAIIDVSWAHKLSRDNYHGCDLWTFQSSETSQFSWSSTIEVKAELKLDEIASVSVGVSTMAGMEISNTVGQERTASTDDIDQATYVLISEPGKTCGTGQINLILSGYLWFEWDDPFRDPFCTNSFIQPGQPCEGKGAAHNDLNHCYDANGCTTHSHWNLHIEEFLPDVADRSNPLKFKNLLSTESFGDYINYCD